MKICGTATNLYSCYEAQWDVVTQLNNDRVSMDELFFLSFSAITFKYSFPYP